jgi:hypothetical protein
MLMNEVLFCGFNELPASKRQALVAHVMDKGNWAKLVNRPESGAVKIRGATYATSAYGHGGGSSVGGNSGGGGGGNVGNEATAPSSSLSSSSMQVKLEQPSSAVVKPDTHARDRFVMPAVGANGAQSGFLNGKTIVITGIFPEVGGGAGLNLGKDKLKAMVEAFGGKVTGTVSGRTNILIVGQNPGFSKVSSAQSQGTKIKIMSIKDLKAGIEGGKLEDIPAAPAITNFSSGYNGNGLGTYALNGAPSDKMLKRMDTASSAGGAADPIKSAQAVQKVIKATKGYIALLHLLTSIVVEISFSSIPSYLIVRRKYHHCADSPFFLTSSHPTLPHPLCTHFEQNTYTILGFMWRYPRAAGLDATCSL